MEDGARLWARGHQEGCCARRGCTLSRNTAGYPQSAPSTSVPASPPRGGWLTSEPLRTAAGHRPLGPRCQAAAATRGRMEGRNATTLLVPEALGGPGAPGTASAEACKEPLLPNVVLGEREREALPASRRL